MGIIKRGILGGFSKKVGNIVGSSWKGVAVIKSMPLSVANPRTRKQVAQRNSFNVCVTFASALLSPIIKLYWDRFAQGMSGYNDFVKTNIVNFADYLNPAWTAMIVSKGTLGTQQINSIAINTGAKNVHVDWSNFALQGNQQNSDVLGLVLWNVTKGEASCIYDGTYTRGMGSVNISLLKDFSLSDTVYAYTMFRSVDGFRVENSQCTLVNLA